MDYTEYMLLCVYPLLQYLFLSSRNVFSLLLSSSGHHIIMPQYCDMTAEGQNSIAWETSIARKRFSKHTPAATDMQAITQEPHTTQCFLCSSCQGYIMSTNRTSDSCETVKYGHESHRAQDNCIGVGQHQQPTDRPTNQQSQTWVGS
jgi:hypothetical protein